MDVSASVMYGVIALVSWGIADFLVKLAVAKEDYYKVLFYAQALGAALLLAFIALSGGFTVMSTEMMLSLAFLGLLWTSAFLAFYKGIEQGKLSIISPVAASWGLVAALIGIFAFSETVTLYSGLGIALATIGVVLASTSLSELRQTKGLVTKGVSYAVYAMLAWGLMFSILDGVVKELGPFLPTLYLKLFLVASLILVVPITKKSIGLPVKSVVPLIVLNGLLEVIAFISFNYGLQNGLVSIVSPTAAAFPAVTVILAYAFLKEHLEFNQKIGIILIIAGLVLMAIV